MSKQTLFPLLRWRDAAAGMAWMQEALGAEVTHVTEGDDRRPVVHAELKLDGATVMASTAPDEPDAFGGPGWGLYVAVDEVDALHERAVAAGAEVVMAPTDTSYGSRDFSVRDPEGNVWSFGTYRPT